MKKGQFVKFKNLDNSYIVARVIDIFNNEAIAYCEKLGQNIRFCLKTGRELFIDGTPNNDIVRVGF